MAKILVIDDEAAMRRLMSNILVSSGHDVMLARDGREGARMLAAGGIDAAVIDIFMPDQDGLETIRDIRKTGLAVKILALSGGGAYGNMSCLKYSQDLGADASMEKPFRPAALSAAIAALLRAA